MQTRIRKDAMTKAPSADKWSPKPRWCGGHVAAVIGRMCFDLFSRNVIIVCQRGKRVIAFPSLQNRVRELYSHPPFIFSIAHSAIDSRHLNCGILLLLWHGSKRKGGLSCKGNFPKWSLVGKGKAKPPIRRFI